MSRWIPRPALVLLLGTVAALSGGCVDRLALAPTDADRGLAPAENGPTMVDDRLAVRPVVGGLVTPMTLAFIGRDEMLVLEKNTGRVQHVVNGAVRATVLDLAVNFGSERGLLGIALHPAFAVDASRPYVYLFWTESSTGVDTGVLSQTPLLGNRVDRFRWTGSALVFDRALLRLRAIQQDAGQPERGNHDGGVLRFGHDGKLYVFVGDLGRRGQLQNLPCGPTPTCPGPIVPDDQFGGPQPDDAHLAGVVLRINDDGSTPADNPFFSLGGGIGGQVGANIQRIFSYGHRNAIGMDIDPRSGNLWLAENGDDSFTELNRVPPGMNGGWIQVMGPVSRIAEFKAIETSQEYFGLQQIRWPPTNLADTPAEALDRLFLLAGAAYVDPEFSWKYEVAPGGIGFVRGNRLGAEYDGNLVVGAATANLRGGHLFRFVLTSDRNRLELADPRLADRVADNLTKNDITESESLLFGSDFGVVPDIRAAPNGNLYVVSLTHGTVYEIYRR
jgi:aldose sugar dehydrogenase